MSPVVERGLREGMEPWEMVRERAARRAFTRSGFLKWRESGRCIMRAAGASLVADNATDASACEQAATVHDLGSPMNPGAPVDPRTLSSSVGTFELLLRVHDVCGIRGNPPGGSVIHFANAMAIISATRSVVMTHANLRWASSFSVVRNSGKPPCGILAPNSANQQMGFRRGTHCPCRYGVGVRDRVTTAQPAGDARVGSPLRGTCS